MKEHAVRLPAPVRLDLPANAMARTPLLADRRGLCHARRHSGAGLLAQRVADHQVPVLEDGPASRAAPFDPAPLHPLAPTPFHRALGRLPCRPLWTRLGPCSLSIHEQVDPGLV